MFGLAAQPKQRAAAVVGIRRAAQNAGLLQPADPAQRRGVRCAGADAGVADGDRPGPLQAGGQHQQDRPIGIVPQLGEGGGPSGELGEGALCGRGDRKLPCAIIHNTRNIHAGCESW